MVLEVIGYKGVVGNATYQWLRAMHPNQEIIGRDLNAWSDKCYAKTKYRADISFVCVPEDSVAEVCREAAGYANLIVVRSTVLPGICRGLQSMLKVHICHVPEFLRETTAVMDAFNPALVIVGACCDTHAAVLRRLYEPVRMPVVVTTPTVSEFLKITLNNYLACLVSFWNEIDEVAARCGLSGHMIGALACMDQRVSPYGARYHHKFSGKCLPKELSRMIGFATAKGVKVPLLRAVEEVNQCQEC